MLKLKIACLISVVCLQLDASLSGARHASEELKEAEIQAGIIYHIANFSEWPNSVQEKDAFTIGFIGESKVRDISSTFSKLKIAGKPVKVKLYYPFDVDVDCDLLFIGKDQSPELSELLMRFKNTQTMTVSGMKHFSLKGGCVGLVKKSSRFKFEINLSAANQEGIQIRSTLLKLANKVYQDE